MESQSNVRPVQSATWERFIASGEWREGQKRTWNRVALLGSGDSCFAQLPTGYGKTLTILGSFVIMRERGLCSRLLILVPTDALREQMAPSSGGGGLASGCRTLGYEPRGVVAISKTPRDIRYAESGRCDIFVATYQQAYTDPQFWQRVMSHGSWMLACDEAHHLTSNTWGEAVQAMPATFRLMLSATPIRTDRRCIVGLAETVADDGSRTIRPDVEVTIEEAMGEGALRRPEAHVHHYFVDVKVPGDDTPIRVTTETLRGEGVSDFSEYEARMQLRYAPKYLSRILFDAYNTWRARELRSPHQNQVLVFAMTNRHAQAVAEQMSALDPDFRVDWIGQSRPDKENSAILDRFKSCSPDERLHALVQVDKAGEGFDNVRCSVLVFLHLVGSPPKLMQQIGRGLRRNYAIKEREQDTVTLLASADTPVAQMVMDLDAACAKVVGAEPKKLDEPRQLSLSLADIPALRVVDVELDRVDLVSRGSVVNAEHVAAARAFMTESGVAHAAMAESDLEKIGARLVARTASPTPATQEFASESAALAYWQKKVKDAVGALASNALKIGGGGSFERSLLGDTIRTVHAQSKRVLGMGHDVMTSDDLKRKYEWVRGVNEAMKSTGQVPSWLSK